MLKAFNGFKNKQQSEMLKAFNGFKNKQQSLWINVMFFKNRYIVKVQYTTI